MATVTLRYRVAVCLALGLFAARSAQAIDWDGSGDIDLAMRAYTALRVGTEHTGGPDNPLTYPNSGAGHVRQHRYFLQINYQHDLTRLARESLGFAGLLRWLDPGMLRYSVQYRGEGEGIYAYGPSEFSDLDGPLRNFRRQSPIVPSLGLNNNRLGNNFIASRVSRVNNVAQQRHRLFMAYGELEKGPFYVRVGRQVLSWGETDVFRLLDNINPVDDSFGGFFIPLDERRVPIEMVRSSWQFGSFGPIADAYLEGFVATGARTSQDPGIPAGSPWSPGGIAAPNPVLRQVVQAPNAEDVRGGARLVFGALDATISIAHYYSYFDVPSGQFRLPRAFGADEVVRNPCVADYNKGKKGNGTSAPSATNPICAYANIPRVPVTGISATWAAPSLYSIFRTEAAYFQGEPMNRQGVGDSAWSDGLSASGAPNPKETRRLRQARNTRGGLNPFVYPEFFNLTRQKVVWGTALQLDTFNMSVGWDINPWVRMLNPHASFFVSTQLFYKHVFDSPGDLVLPVPFRNLRVSETLPIAGSFGCSGKAPGPNDPGFVKGKPCKVAPRLFHLADDRFLQTLLITTPYFSGKVNPYFGMFYDWQGGMVFQPGVQIIRDPFRLVFDYTAIQAAPTGQFGAVRDRDNVRFQVEYVF